MEFFIVPVRWWGVTPPIYKDNRGLPRNPQTSGTPGILADISEVGGYSLVISLRSFPYAR